jgi:two-component system, cell cycle response regulator
VDPYPIESLLDRLENLPTLPGIALRILEAIKNEETNLDELGRILSTDPPLSGKILGLINSAFYALPVKVTSVSHAVNLLGLDTVKKVALGFSLLPRVKTSSQDEFDYAEFWRDSLMAAVVCRLLAKNILPSMAEDGFTLGLLHEIGRLALNRSIPKQYSLVLKERRDTLCDYYQAEKEILGFTHMELGGALLKKWTLPEFFYEPVQVHHLPDRIEPSAKTAGTLGKILFLASQVVEYYSGEKKNFSLGSLKTYLARWGYDRKIDSNALIEEAHRHIKEISDLFEVRLEDEEAYLSLIEEARRELILISDRFLEELLEQKKKVESLRAEVMRDGLTGLYNYKSFHYFVNQEYNRAKRYHLPLTLVLADIDHFKTVNDTFGHLAGDEVLRHLSRTLGTSLRNSDILARHGGEEFGILLIETLVTDSLLTIERFRLMVESLGLEYEGKIIKVTMSFGLAFFQPGSDLSRDEWVKQADRALYEAKRRGRNRTCVYGVTGEGIRPARTAGVV